MRLIGLLAVSILLYSSLFAYDAYVCIDGGASHISLQVLDRQFKPYTLKKGNQTLKMIDGPASNINALNQNRFRLVIENLVKGVEIVELNALIEETSTYLIVGMAGLGSDDNNAIAQSIFRSLGFEKSTILSDAHLALKLCGEQGILLISGTGSIALGIDQNKTFRCGGFGRLIGDEGSGYFMGMQMIKAMLEESFGYGKKTLLTPQICKKFHLENPYDIVSPIHSGRITPTQIASLANLIFEITPSDPIAQSIVDETARRLAQHVLHIVNQMANQNSDLPLLLMGGLFSSNTRMEQRVHQYLRHANCKFNIKNLQNVSIACEAAKKMFS